MSEPRSFLSAAVSDTGKVYVMGGVTAASTASQPGVTTNEEYDTATDTWTARAPLPVPLYAHGAAFLNGKVYVVGGRTPPNDLGTADVRAYDTATDTWSSVAPLPTARFWLGVVAYQGKIWALGGYTNTMVSGALLSPQPYIGVDSYDPVTNTWAPGANVPAEPTSAVAGGSILALDGFHVSNPALPIQPSSIQWGNGASFSDSFPSVFQANTGTYSYPCTVGLNGRFYVLGGVVSVPPPGTAGSLFTGGPSVPDVLSFDVAALPNLSSQMHAPMANSRVSFGAVAAPNGRIYVFGGEQMTLTASTPFGLLLASTRLGSVEEFQP